MNFNNKKIKKQRIDIKTIEDFKKNLEVEMNIYFSENFLEEDIEKIFIENFQLEKNLRRAIIKALKDDISYRAENLNDFIEYIRKIELFESSHERLSELFKGFNFIEISRREYESRDDERVKVLNKDVSNIAQKVEKIKNEISEKVTFEELNELAVLESKIKEKYLYAKDVELLKKMFINKDNEVFESYDEINNIKTIKLKIPKTFYSDYIKVKKGTVEYHRHLDNNIERINRLIKNLTKYMVKNKREKTIELNQSKLLQDSVNLALVIFDNKEFKAISGKNDIDGYCETLSSDEGVFKGVEVNKRGEIGVGYERINDSEKKIIEKINKGIKNNLIKDKGSLTLYSYWEPCPSCYYVISQFSEIYPKIKIKVKYNKKYGEY